MVVVKAFLRNHEITMQNTLKQHENAANQVMMEMKENRHEMSKLVGCFSFANVGQLPLLFPNKDYFYILNFYKTPAELRDIFRDTHIAKKYDEGEIRTHDLLAWKQKNQALARARTQELVSTRQTHYPLGHGG